MQLGNFTHQQLLDRGLKCSLKDVNGNAVNQNSTSIPFIFSTLWINKVGAHKGICD